MDAHNGGDGHCYIQWRSGWERDLFKNSYIRWEFIRTYVVDLKINFNNFNFKMNLEDLLSKAEKKVLVVGKETVKN
jgi:hypothetical protein